MNNEDPIRFMFPAAQAPFLQILHRAAPHLLRQPQFLAAGGAATATAALGGFDAQRMHRAPRQRRRHDRNGRCFGECFKPFLVVNLVILRVGDVLIFLLHHYHLFLGFSWFFVASKIVEKWVWKRFTHFVGFRCLAACARGRVVSDWEWYAGIVKAYPAERTHAKL